MLNKKPLSSHVKTDEKIYDGTGSEATNLVSLYFNIPTVISNVVFGALADSFNTRFVSDLTYWSWIWISKMASILGMFYNGWFSSWVWSDRLLHCLVYIPCYNWLLFWCYSILCGAGITWLAPWLVEMVSHDPLKRSYHFNRIQFIPFKGNVHLQLWNLFWICSVHGNWIGHRWPELDLGLYHYGNFRNCACSDISITRNQMFE